MAYSRPLPELRRADEPRFGGKSASLGELLCAGIPVPPGFALSVDAHAAYVAEGGFPAAVRAALASAWVRECRYAAASGAERAQGVDAERADSPAREPAELTCRTARMLPSGPTRMAGP